MPSSLSRRVLSAVAVAAVAALSLSACAGSDPAAQGDGEVVWAIEGANLSAGHMDPQTSQLDVSAMVQRAVLDSLVFQEADGTFSPWLAESWDVEDGGASYLFRLRTDVTFHDGTPFDAAAVKANFDRIVNPDTASAQAASMLGGVTCTPAPTSSTSTPCGCASRSPTLRSCRPPAPPCSASTRRRCSRPRPTS